MKRKGVAGWARRNGGDSVAWVMHARLGRFFSWLTERRVISANPCAAVRRPDASAARERTLTDVEIKLFWMASGKMGELFSALLTLLLLLGQRRGELSGLRWSELDGDTRTIPAIRMKNSRQHIVPLPKAAVDLIATIQPIGETFVFTTTGQSPVSGWSKVKARLDLKMAELAGEQLPSFTLHDLRRTCASGLQSLGIPLPVTERVLNHRSGSLAGIVSVYQVHEYGPEKREALNRWASRVAEITA